MATARRKAAGSAAGASRVLMQVEHPGGARAGRMLTSRAREFLTLLKLQGRELSLVVTTDRKIRKINREWRQKDQATDVLSFPAGEQPMPEGEPVPLGDVVISLDTARRVAKEEKCRLDEELSRYLAHGILHLLGHDHHEPKEAAAMARQERRLLGGVGLIARAGAEPEPATAPARKRVAAKKNSAGTAARAAVPRKRAQPAKTAG